MSTEPRRVEVRPWSLDELPLPSGIPDGVAAFGAAGDLPFGADLGLDTPLPAGGNADLGGYGGSFGDSYGGYGGYGAGSDAAAYADLPPLPGALGTAPPGTGDRAEQLELARAEGAAEGYERGFAEGEQQARAEREPAVEAVLAALEEAVAGIRAHEARWAATLEENIAALAVLVARHVVQREVSADPALLRQLVTGALSQFPVDQAVTVRLHPEELQACRTLLGEGLPLPELRWVPDPAVGRGGCLVEGRERILDGRLDVALERAYRALAGIGA